MPMPSFGGWDEREGGAAGEVYSARRAMALWIAVSLAVWLVLAALVVAGC